jgi:hypothetical protein
LPLVLPTQALTGVGGDLILDKHYYVPLKYRPGTGGSSDQRSASLVPGQSQRTSTKISRYETLVEDQCPIGWNQLIFGRWSTLWATHHCRTSNDRKSIQPHQPWHWLDQSHNYSDLDPLSQSLARPKSSPQSTNQNLAGRHRA